MATRSPTELSPRVLVEISAVASAAICERSWVVPTICRSSSVVAGTRITTRPPQPVPQKLLTLGTAASAVADSALARDLPAGWLSTRLSAPRVTTTGPKSHRSRALRSPAASPSVSPASSQPVVVLVVTKVRYSRRAVGCGSKSRSA